jgi:diguanylate cyclase (GGDEF)-like protein/PAS domain S-box-containing protein
MRKRAWLVYPVLAAVATTLYYVVYHQNSYVYNIIGASSPLMIIAAILVRKPKQRTPWILFALGQAFFITGDVLAYHWTGFYQAFFHHWAIFGDGTLPYPGPADAFYIAVYPCLAFGLYLLIRSRNPRRSWATTIDSAMIGIGVGTLSWIFLVSPNFQAGLPFLQELTSMAYPLGDLLLITVAIRLAVGAGKKVPAFFTMMISVIALFGTDAIYGWTLLGDHPYTPGNGPLEIGWIAFYVLWATAALQPSMHDLSEQVPDVDARFTRSRLTLLGAASLLAPAAELFQHFHDPKTIDLPVEIGATVVLFVLVLMRMAGLLTREERSAKREKALREAGAALVTATNRESILTSAMGAAGSLAADVEAIRMCVMTDESERLEVIAASSGEDSAGRTFVLGQLESWTKARLNDNVAVQIPLESSEVAAALGMPLTPGGSLFLSPLFIREALKGIMILSSPNVFTRQVTEGLEALCSQVALALESAQLTEDLLVKQSEARFASLVQNASDMVTVIEPDTTVRYASPSSSRVLGIKPEDLEGSKLSELVHAEDAAKAFTFLSNLSEPDGNIGLMELKIRHGEGHWIWVEMLRTNLLHDPNVRGIVLNTRDITERKNFEEQLSHQAFHDSITNLANRALFKDRVVHALERQQRDPRPVSIIFMDLDDFKTINDSLGHAAGDTLLAEVGERLHNCLRAADTAARLGGDEFAVLLDDAGEGIQAADVATRILDSFDTPFILEGKEMFVRASLGIAIADSDSEPIITDAEELLRNADVAMYMAKENGKGRYQVFEPQMHDTALKRLELKADLQRALEHDEFALFYQPVIELETGRISGVEALIRWFRPDGTMVPPLDFIPLAEETGLIVPIGRWVLRTACRYAVDLQEMFPGPEPYHMAVNLSARQLARPEVVEEVREILQETGLQPGLLILEITESVMMADMELSIARLGELKALGVKLAIDDFGTGYSSLNYVRRFPVDILKVDKSFIDGVSDGGESSALTAAVIELAGILNLKPVAEGIERADQLERLQELHCDLGQGFFFAKPLKDQELQALLEERRSMEAEAGLRRA